MKPCEQGLRCPHRMSLEIQGDVCLMARTTGGHPMSIKEMLDIDCFIIDKPEEIKQIEEEYGELDNDYDIDE